MLLRDEYSYVTFNETSLLGDIFLCVSNLWSKCRATARLLPAFSAISWSMREQGNVNAASFDDSGLRNSFLIQRAVLFQIMFSDIPGSPLVASKSHLF